jgi:F420-non-reducing hydrogenase small subunit
MAKPKIALYWCAGCGGCEESVVDLAEDILMVVEAVDIVFWPVAMDFKHSDVEALADGELAAVLINGAVRTDEQEHMAKLLRKKAKVVIAHGACAHLGGVPGLANFHTNKEILERVYKEVHTVNNPQGALPEVKVNESGQALELPAFHNTVKALNQVIDVDYYLPGCPPTPELIKNAVLALLTGKLPPSGSVLAEKQALCNSCSRRDSKPEKIQLKEFKRIHQAEIDQTKCFLADGFICLGPATRGGCQERCIKANMPCRGCFGPLDNVSDQGAKSLSLITSLIDSNDPEEIKRIADSIPDPAGLFYRYSLPTSLLGGRIDKREPKK